MVPLYFNVEIQRFLFFQCLDVVAAFNSCWVGQPCSPAKMPISLKAVCSEKGAQVGVWECNISTHNHVFLNPCCSPTPAEAWCIQSSAGRALPCTDDGQIQPPRARWALVYCGAWSRLLGLVSSASCSPGSTQLTRLLHRCFPPPPPVLLLCRLLAPCQGTLAGQSFQTQDGHALRTSLIESWCFFCFFKLRTF